jgi:hypothetical protein
MARNVIDFSYIEIDAPSTGRKELETCMEMEIETTDPSAGTVKTLRRLKKPIGHKSGIPDHTLTLKVAQTIPGEVDWFALWRSQELVQITYEEAAGNVAGDRYFAEDCRVTEIKRGFTSEGEASYDVSLLPLHHDKEG